jgi:raffinose/stachyose/melibiose transport system substrate-binding protein
MPDSVLYRNYSWEAFRTWARRDLLGFGLRGAAGLSLLPAVLDAFDTNVHVAHAATQLSLLAGTGDAPGAKVAIARFQKSNPGITINAKYLADFGTLLRTGVATGTAPDIFQVAPGNGQIGIGLLAKAGALADLSQEPWAARIPATFRPVTDANGKVYMMPVGLGAMAMFYNTEIFGKVGVTVPTTWNEFITVCTKIKKAGYVPIGLGAQDGLGPVLIGYVTAASAAYAPDPALPSQMAQGKVTFAHSGWKLALEEILELNQRGFFNKSPNGISGDGQVKMLATGKVAMAPQLTNQYSVLLGYAGRSIFSTFAYPADNNPAHGWIPAGLSFGYGLNAHSANVETAKRFLRFLSQPSELAAYDDAIGNLPFRKDIPVKVPKGLAPIVNLVAQGRSVTYYDQLWPNADVEGKVIQGIQSLLVGQSSVASVLASMDQAYMAK